ncbi:hypothetical protein SORBI_3008G145500 [Sorghum bicolor]|uniref:Uncharacterized protein n=1 Tax=Sorghum bicolor TaxID=4558 RepID=A0A1B6PE72_SORBI|nr:hypothetical protein SORBI_3008G145500 [Sorghum bicolor]
MATRFTGMVVAGLLLSLRFGGACGSEPAASRAGCVEPLRLWRRQPVFGWCVGAARIFFSSACLFLRPSRHRRRLPKSPELVSEQLDPVSARPDPELWQLDPARTSRADDGYGWPRRRRWRQPGVSARPLGRGGVHRVGRV